MSFSKISESDVFQTYRAAYSTKIDWSEIFEEDILNWLSIYEKSKNCSLNLVMPALISLTSSICGPETKITGQENGFSSSLNSYLLAVCDPGGGKSATYANVVEPVVDFLYEKTGKRISVENYTAAGLQKHQISNNGYGLITTDEGHRFLSTVNQKQSKGESERSNLCKMWCGKGDHIQLATGIRGFGKTSLSMCLFIQPHPLMTELTSMSGNDGFLDRFLMVVSRPILHPTVVVKVNYKLLQESGLMGFKHIFWWMYEDHQKGIEYSLSIVAQKEFDEMSDSFAEYLNDKYIETVDPTEDKENIPCSQANLFMTSSKDMIHVLRLAVILKIISHYIRKGMRKDHSCSPNNEVSEGYLKRGRKLYQYMAQQKSVFVQALNSMQLVKKVQPFFNRLAKGIALSNGPMVSVRDLQRKLKGALKDSIHHVLETLQANSCGNMIKIAKREIFLKPSPTAAKESEMLQKSGVTFRDL